MHLTSIFFKNGINVKVGSGIETLRLKENYILIT